MMQHIKPALMMLLVFTLLTGIAYPLLVTLGAQALLPTQANGSLILNGQKVVGSELIGQAFTRPEYFWGRPSATSPNSYNAAASSGSNLGPSNPALTQRIQASIKALRDLDPNTQPIPVDLVTASASGLDPHISPAAAEYQVSRIAKARKIDPEKLQELVRLHTEGGQWGLLGEPRVNVLKLNLALSDTTTLMSSNTEHIDYSLPPSKVYVEACKNKVSMLHPGEIEKEQMLHRHGDFWVESLIQANDGNEWRVLCDLSTGKVLREQKLPSVPL